MAHRDSLHLASNCTQGAVINIIELVSKQMNREMLRKTWKEKRGQRQKRKDRE